MAIQNELIVRIGANAKEFQNELGKVQGQTKDLENSLSKLAKISAVAWASGTVAIAATTKAAADFEAKFTDVVTLLDKGSFSTMNLNQGIDSLRKGVIELGQETGQSFDSLNKALFDLISAGVPAEKAIETLRVTTSLAAAGATDTATAVQALTATMTAFGESAGDAQAIAEKFFTAQKFGVTTVGDLAKEFNKVAGLAKNLGISFDEALASLSSLTADGAKPTAEAATQLKAALNGIINVQQNLSKESEAVQQALSLQNLEKRGLIGTLQDFNKATGGSVEEQKRLLGSSEALQAVLSLTGAQSELVAKQMKEMADEQNRAAVFAEALKTKQETARIASEKFSRVIESAAIIIGEQFAPILSKAADVFGGFIKILANNSVIAKTAALILGVGTALAGLLTVGGAAIVAFTQIRAAMIALNISTRVLALGIKGLVGATGLGLLAIAAVEIYNNWGTIWPAVVKIFEATMKAIAGIGAGIGKILKGIFTLDSSAISEGMDMAKKAIGDGLSDIANSFKKQDVPKIEVPIEAKIDEEQIKNEVQKANQIDSITTQQAAPAKDESFKQHKEQEEKKTKVSEDEARKRIAANREQIEIIKMQNEGASQEEIDFLKRKNDLAIAEENAKKIANDELRASELDVIRAQNEQLLQEQQEFFQRKREQDAEQREQEKVLQEELKALSDEERSVLNEQELQQLRDQIATKREIESQAAQEKLKREIDERNQFLKNEQRFGTTYANLRKVFNQEEVQGAQQAANQLVQLQNSKNEQLRGIGKASALVQLAINTARGALDAYSALAGIPIVGPGLGIAAAGALVAYGAEQKAKVLAANTGGVVPTNMGVPGRDSVPAMLTPGELVVPQRNFDEVVGAVANSRQGGAGGESNSPLVNLLASIDNKLNALGSPITINGDVLNSESFVDELITKIRDAREFRNAKL